MVLVAVELLVAWQGWLGSKSVVGLSAPAYVVAGAVGSAVAAVVVKEAKSGGWNPAF